MLKTRPRSQPRMLQDIIQEIVTRQELPYGTDIRFENNGRRVRSDKVCRWISFGKLQKEDATVGDLIDRLSKRISGIDFDNIYVYGPNEPSQFKSNKTLKKLREMEEIPTPQEEYARQIYEETKSDIKRKIEQGYDRDTVLDAYLTSLMANYSSREISDAVQNIEDNDW